MNENAESSLTQDVADWWNANPFTYSDDGVGYVSPESLDEDFFAKVERAFRGFHPHLQDAGRPLLSNVIDYDFVRGRRILDVGTGSGFLAADFARNGGTVTAVDITDWAVEAATRNLACHGLDGRVVRMDAQEMTFPDRSFDFVCAWGCIMHMPDTSAAVREIYRVLDHGGKHFAWVYHKGWTYYVNIMLLRGILMGQLARHGFSINRLVSRYTDGAHIGGNRHTKCYSAAEAKRMYEAAGFRNVRVEPIYNPRGMDAWPFGRLPIGKHLPESLRVRLGNSISWELGIWAEKP